MAFLPARDLHEAYAGPPWLARWPPVQTWPRLRAPGSPALR
ncbi:uncharacterized protein SOCEGT47_069670 [Sorangium cellulosum]|uniref:Uncharacterized protein n=1 Tax=Sorangium cellulosum TaxID=56 RepID=A0A4P2QAV1_SORCE|nr:uncharacterized protein SOCEGT47_069670 [Sorangium cellulosum]